MPSNEFLGVLTGNDHFTPANRVKDAIATRAAHLISKITPKEGDHCYDGNRCEPVNLGWRFQQEIGNPSVQEIVDGKWDAEIEWIYHHAANAEHYYRNQKDWG
jgi:hypothetical protein